MFYRDNVLYKQKKVCHHFTDLKKKLTSSASKFGSRFLGLEPCSFAEFYFIDSLYRRTIYKEFLMGVGCLVLQILTLFQTKNVIFHTRFQTLPLKSVSDMS